MSVSIGWSWSEKKGRGARPELSHAPEVQLKPWAAATSELSHQEALGTGTMHKLAAVSH